jgi:hypothetical protein
VSAATIQSGCDLRLASPNPAARSSGNISPSPSLLTERSSDTMVCSIKGLAPSEKK